MILSCGEALIDLVPLGEGYRPYPGGSPYNIAIALGRLETPVGFLGKISTDFFGEMLINNLIHNQVDTRYIIRADGLTTLGIVSLPSQHQEPQFSFYANDSVDRNLTIAELPTQFPSEVKVLHFGSISLVLEPGATALEQLMQRESKHRFISLDPNIRPHIITDKVAYSQRLENWLKSVDIIRVSVADLNWLYPKADPETIIKQWLNLGPILGILTLGAQGAKAYTRASVAVLASVPAIQVVDTVGAGDSFLAAVLAYLNEQNLLTTRTQLMNISVDQLTACLNYASRAAAINCSRAGANPARKSELI
ncbi:MAG: carbohydrate kinase [Thioploca sp.]|nr:carbohydrate kinase [Thioploca sp.]